MTLLSELVAANAGAAAYARRKWRGRIYVEEWEEHLWVFCAGNRLAPWCPTLEDLTANDWELADPS